MTERLITARAPSNIALVKYMGKSDASSNLAPHPSLSMTLNGLHTVTELRRINDTTAGFNWVLESPRALQGHAPPLLNDRGLAKLERHFERLRTELPAILSRHGLPADTAGTYECRSANTFPSGTGIASSASSYAALTLAGAAALSADPAAFRAAWSRTPELKSEIAALSRKGSGSSCRSFHGPWVLWSGETSQPIESCFPPMADLVLVVSETEKAVPSSDAHALIKSSPLWQGRPERATVRAAAVREALNKGDFARVAREAWQDAWEMHSLFHTSEPPFTYWEPATLEIIRWLSGLPGVIVTLDAGPNVHVLVAQAEATAWKKNISQRFPGLRILEDTQGTGADLL